ncbi:PDR/VanB family oxidoreductase [Gordonia alkanivorans]|uniref:PDR/VanB family oxidoreductase n=1 Tax=Gordonia alkanivorans TaxID=84096 RepID=UPI00244CE113|nr:PDR/VanB family oxidoreductase [Gordonia alkanivorans]MDH3005442.1 PDR/VanB family oxidoreductase [Gordonia alkanivorans]MDH3049172.1 PDR/VanB family oxidoreductase [Gordonia alkanivorans]MDJ0026989.1 PDR/VanB family oxidoreductase [Gordonia alkanivorans]
MTQPSAVKGPAAGASDDAQWIEAVVSGVRSEGIGVVSLSLEAGDGTALPDFSPGAHVDLDLGNDLVRQYSLCGPRHEPTWRIAVLRERESRGGSERAHRLSCGDRVRVRGPRNHFPLEDADEYLFIAGGIGVTPILPMLRDAEERGIPWSLHYGGRTRDSMAFAAELAGYDDKVHLYPQDEVGVLDLTRILGGPHEGVGVYCCGPEGLLTAVESETGSWPHGALHTERFSPAEPVGPRIGDTPFEVECQMSGVTVTVAEDETILEAVERTGGVIVSSSCREGTCGTCEATVLDGVPDHRDSVLTDDERDAGDVIMTCVSRACTARLVLDL